MYLFFKDSIIKILQMKKAKRMLTDHLKTIYKEGNQEYANKVNVEIDK